MGSYPKSHRRFDPEQVNGREGGIQERSQGSPGSFPFSDAARNTDLYAFSLLFFSSLDHLWTCFPACLETFSRCRLLPFSVGEWGNYLPFEDRQRWSVVRERTERAGKGEQNLYCFGLWGRKWLRKGEVQLREDDGGSKSGRASNSLQGKVVNKRIRVA